MPIDAVSGSQYTGDDSSSSALYKPFWVKITAVDAPTGQCAWKQQLPVPLSVSATGYQDLPGGAFGTTTVNPTVSIVRSSPPAVSSIVQVTRSYYDTNLGWVYVVTSTVGGPTQTLTVENTDGTQKVLNVDDLIFDPPPGWFITSPSAGKAKVAAAHPVFSFANPGFSDIIAANSGFFTIPMSGLPFTMPAGSTGLYYLAFRMTISDVSIGVVSVFDFANSNLSSILNVNSVSAINNSNPPFKGFMGATGIIPLTAGQQVDEPIISYQSPGGGSVFIGQPTLEILRVG